MSAPTGHDSDASAARVRRKQPQERRPDAPRRHVTVALVSFGSPWHYALWNNLSVDTLAGHLEGVFASSVRIRVLRADSLTASEQVVQALLEESPDIVGLSIELGTLTLVDRFIDTYNNCTFERQPVLALGNQIPTYFPERFIDDARFQDVIVCLHEGEKSIEGLVRCVRGKSQLRDVPNLVFRDTTDGRIVRTELRTLLPDELIHPAAVYTAHSGITNMVQASRDCIFSCSFCTRHDNWNAGSKLSEADLSRVEQPPSGWRPFHLSRVFRNVEQLVEKGIREIEFCDDEFFGGRSDRGLKRVNEFADGMRRIAQQYETRLTFRLFTTPLVVARMPTSERIVEQNRRVRETLENLVDAGLVRVYIGLESANRAQKERYNRTESLDDTTLALQVLRDLNLDIDVGFIMFDPYMTVDAMLENVQYFRDQNLVEHNTWPFRPLVVNEGTAIKSCLDEDGLLTGNQDPDFLSHEYRFQDDTIGEISRIVQTIAAPTAPIFYALKTISKAHWKSEESNQTQFASRACVDNALIYLDLMEELGMSALRNGFKKRMELSAKAIERIHTLVNRVKEQLVGGLFDERERDKTILRQHIDAFETSEPDRYEGVSAPRRLEETQKSRPTSP